MSAYSNGRDGGKHVKDETVDSEKPWSQMRERVGEEDERALAVFDPHQYYNEQVGRLVISPECILLCLSFDELETDVCPANREARAEFGAEVADRLKLSRDGTKVLWPQPTDDPRDPMNVCSMSSLLRAEANFEGTS